MDFKRKNILLVPRTGTWYLAWYGSRKLVYDTLTCSYQVPGSSKLWETIYFYIKHINKQNYIHVEPREFWILFENES